MAGGEIKVIQDTIDWNNVNASPSSHETPQLDFSVIHTTLQVTRLRLSVLSQPQSGSHEAVTRLLRGIRKRIGQSMTDRQSEDLSNLIEQDILSLSRPVTIIEVPRLSRSPTAYGITGAVEKKYNAYDLGALQIPIDAFRSRKREGVPNTPSHNCGDTLCRFDSRFRLCSSG